MVKERGILVSTPMVQAIHEDRKTVTRRIINPQPKLIESSGRWYWEKALDVDGDPLVDASQYWWEYYGTSPYGKAGDILYIREMYYDYGLWDSDGYTKTGKIKWTFQSVIPSSADIRYFENPPEDVRPNSYRKPGWYKRMGRFMPYFYVRTKLLIKSISVERLHDITEEDAIKEGVEVDEWTWGPMAFPDGTIDKSLIGKKTKWYRDYSNHKDGLKHWFNDGARASFITLWQSINGVESWNTNPWTWRIEFERIKQTIL
jgi:hypothetical protein